MAGNVHRHGNGWKAVVVDGFGRGAKRRVVGTFRTKAIALDELRRAESEVLVGNLIDRQAGKVSLVDRMRADIARRSSDWSHNTTVGHLNSLQHVEAFFHSSPIAAVKHSDVQAFVSQLELAPSTVRTVYGHLRETLRMALADSVIGRDPAVRIKLPREPKRAMEIPTDLEIEALFASAPTGFGAAVVLGAGAGLRAQEAAGVVVEDVDWFGRTLHVHRQWHGRLGGFADLKDHEDRIVPVGEDVLEALSTHIGQHGTGEHGLLVHANGLPVNGARFKPRWTKAKAGAGELTYKFHALRHHYASTAISANVPIPMLSKALGHSTSSITLDTYGWLMEGDDDRLRNAATVRFHRESST